MCRAHRTWSDIISVSLYFSVKVTVLCVVGLELVDILLVTPVLVPEGVQVALV